MDLILAVMAVALAIIAFIWCASAVNDGEVARALVVAYAAILISGVMIVYAHAIYYGEYGECKKEIEYISKDIPIIKEGRSISKINSSIPLVVKDLVWHTNWSAQSYRFRIEISIPNPEYASAPPLITIEGDEFRREQHY